VGFQVSAGRVTLFNARALPKLHRQHPGLTPACLDGLYRLLKCWGLPYGPHVFDGNLDKVASEGMQFTDCTADRARHRPVRLARTEDVFAILHS
jgi:hypothetical protein